MKLLNLIDKVSEFTGKLASYLMLAVASIVIFEILMRSLFNKSTNWSFEMSSFLFGVFWVLGGAYALLNKTHINMDLFYNKFSPRKKAIMDSITFIFILIFLLALGWSGYLSTLKSIEFGERGTSIWRPYLWPVKIWIPIGVFLFLIQAIAQFTRNIITAINKGKV